MRSKILVKCKIDGYEWEARADHLLEKRGCPICGYKQIGNKNRKSHDNYIKECESLGFNILEKYQGYDTPILHSCIRCGAKFKTAPHRILTGNTGCPHCNKSKSKAEWAITDILDSNNINFNPEYTVNINDHFLRYDFWLPDYNCFIEYDGKQHFESIEHWGGESQLEQRQLYDKWKDEYCEQNNINLLRIKYTTPMEEFENIIFNFIKEAV